MSGVLWRILIALVCVLITFALIPPVLRIVGLDASSDVLLVVKLCVGGLALLYILRGPTPSWPT